MKKVLTFLFIIPIINGCTPLTIMSVGGFVYDRYEKKAIEVRLDELEQKEKKNVREVF